MKTIIQYKLIRLLQTNTFLFIGLVVMGVAAFFWLNSMRKISLRVKKRVIDFSSGTLARMLAVCVLAWLVTGVGFIILNNSLGFHFEYSRLIAANTLAFSLGMLAVFAPGGVGVREFVFSVFMINPTTIIYWRLVVFVVDFIVGVPSALGILRTRK